MRPFLLTFTCYLLCSCGTGLKVKKEKLQPIQGQFSLTLVNQANKTSKSKDGPIEGPSFLKFFGLPNSPCDSVKLTLDNNQQLTISYQDSTVIRTLSYNTKLRKGYLEISSVDKKINIPPLLPIFYSRVKTDRKRIGITTQHELVLDHKWEDFGSILFLLGGAGGRTQYFFPYNDH
ncbi:hypothetical protein [Fulvivirga ligni]|uniref:hypothetical protein n=1 Tax=Fulvivirga ligni TaxID=2904246 RepID=UPI001F216F53|nr:hypothetical protein [Fulvivirga ligni]UII21019.1 hypothetical protein LVD16_24555 [Fulvivirga ligni]